MAGRPRKTAEAQIITPSAQAKYYEVLNDGILGAAQPLDRESTPSEWKVLTGRVTQADLIAAGVDIKWQIEIGNLMELGFVPA